MSSSRKRRSSAKKEPCCQLDKEHIDRLFKETSKVLSKKKVEEIKARQIAKIDEACKENIADLHQEFPEKNKERDTQEQYIKDSAESKKEAIYFEPINLLQLPLQCSTSYAPTRMICSLALSQC